MRLVGSHLHSSSSPTAAAQIINSFVFVIVTNASVSLEIANPPAFAFQQKLGLGGGEILSSMRICKDLSVQFFINDSGYDG